MNIWGLRGPKWKSSPSSNRRCHFSSPWHIAELMTGHRGWTSPPSWSSGSIETLRNRWNSVNRRGNTFGVEQIKVWFELFTIQNERFESIFAEGLGLNHHFRLGSSVLFHYPKYQHDSTKWLDQQWITIRWLGNSIPSSVCGSPLFIGNICGIWWNMG